MFKKGGEDMAKIEFQIETCRACHDAAYCTVHWGPACKRQGGNRIPRMKTTNVTGLDKIEKEQPNKVEKPRKRKNVMVEPIRTRAANW
jgi:hypothetical protein